MHKGNRVAIIDLGSNTFHLLILDIDQKNNSFTQVFRKREFIYLAKAGIEFIAPANFERGILCLTNFENICKKYSVDNIHAVGTSALRTATNGLEFIEAVKMSTAIDVNIISGREEARLINLGVRHQYPTLEKAAVMDIGGGSVEFIYSEKNEIKWYHSIDIGISVLRNDWNNSDPATKDEVKDLYRYLDQKVGLLFSDFENSQISQLIGVAGPFEIIELIFERNEDIKRSSLKNWPRNTILDLCDKIVYANLEERKQIPGMPETRFNLSLEAMVLIKYVLERCQSIDNVHLASQTMKEGILIDSYF